MAEQRVQRRLAAILAADMVGYSRLMEADETGTIARQKAHRSELIDPEISVHGGRIVKTMGDGLLVEFPSVVDAVKCAVAVQQAMAVREADVPEDRRIQYRIGINLGDVIIDGDDILGDGVNVAARLEGLAEPGGICVSEKVFAEVGNKLDTGFEDLGPQAVKNIAEPVRAFQVRLDAGGKAGKSAPQNRQRRVLVISGVVVVSAASAAIGFYAWLERSPPALQSDAVQSDAVAAVDSDRSVKTELALPDRPSIAVLPFENMSGDPEQNYFADGMTEDIITDLSKLSALFVIARNSSFQYKGQTVDVKKVGHELGVGYILEGSVRRAGDQVRINAQLIDTRTGGHLWAERYDGSLADVFALQDKVTSRIIEALSVTLEVNETAELADHGTSNIAAHDAFLKGQELSRRYTSESTGQAVAYYKRALELDPDYSRASAALAQVLYTIWRNAWGQAAVSAGYAEGGLPGVSKAIKEAKRYAKMALKNPTPAAHIAQALLLQPERRYEEAINHAQTAITLDPNDAEGYLSLGNLLVLAGEPERAISHFKNARRLDPHNVESIDQGLGLAYFGMERFDDAVLYLERARDAAPSNYLNWMYLAATYAYLGRSDDAKAAVNRMNALRRAQGLTTFRADMVSFSWFFKKQSDENRLKQGLLKAGVPKAIY